MKRRAQDVASGAYRSNSSINGASSCNSSASSDEESGCLAFSSRKKIVIRRFSAAAGNVPVIDLSMDMKSLSIKERERVQEEVHGVGDLIQEAPEMIETALLALDRHLSKSAKSKTAYDKALFLSPKFPKRRSLRLQFLRSENFNVPAAAARISRHFEVKLRLFGLDGLCKDITQSDLSDDDMHALKSGSIQVLPCTDRSKRRILSFSHLHLSFRDVTNQLRNFWYQAMKLLDNDEDAQRFGLVGIIYNISGPPTADVVGSSNANSSNNTPPFAALMKEAAGLYESLPFRFAARHFLYDDRRLQPIMSFVQMAIGSHGRVRFRPHFGSHLEAQYALMSFGIPTEQLPMDSNGNMHLEAFHNRLRDMREAEAAIARTNQSDSRILYPTTRDCLMGRGKPYQDFPGNVRLAVIIDFHRNRYQQGNRGEKTVLSEEVRFTIAKSGGRFLKRIDSDLEAKDGNSNGCWVEVENNVARQKISHGFRTKTRRNEDRQVSTAIPLAVTSQSESPVSERDGKRARVAESETVNPFSNRILSFLANRTTETHS